MDRKNIKTNPLLESYREHIERIDKALEAELNLYVESEFTEPLKYAIADGKRIRPIILALAAESAGGENADENVYAAACAVENFASSIGVDSAELVSYMGSEKTRRAVSRITALMGTLGEGAAAMYAFEKEIPKISQIKLQGLKEFYGLDSENATNYFKLHMSADVRHAESWRCIVDASEESADDLYSAAVKSVWAQNLLLDTCYEQYCHNTLYRDNCRFE